MEMKIKKAYLGKATENIEILGIKWVSFKGSPPRNKFSNPKLCLHVRFKDGRENYFPINRNVISCKWHTKANRILVVH